MDKNKQSTLLKVKRMLVSYSKLYYKIIETLSVKFYKPEKEFFTVPDDSFKWSVASKGQTWGEGDGYCWFKAKYTVPEKYSGHELWIMSESGENESLLFVNNQPKGLFDYTVDILRPQDRLHRLQPLTLNAIAGDEYTIALEAYGGRDLRACTPLGPEIFNDMYPLERDRVFKGIYIVQYDETVHNFLLKLRTAIQLFENLDENNYVKWEICNTLYEIFRIVPQIPNELPYEIWHSAIEKANSLLEGALSNKCQDKTDSQFGEYGLIGHSHLDTAWRWTVDETVHKAARTFSNALSLMDRYDDYIFMQSSVVYIEWMHRYYPEIYNGIKKYIAEGRWEPNGGSWVECDGNMTGGEYLIRQFLRGQKYMQDNFGYRADCFWQPDTFGYSPAIPQIMLGCGLKYFYTTKLAWNECNTFPYDTFYWKGIDGSRVLSHFNLMHCWPDAETVLKAPVMQKDVTNAKLIAYGFGDGGGGPSGDMIETANIIKDLKCLPKTRHTTVSGFMQRLENNANDIPVYDGELYLELHRGTLTQMHDIKQTNRQAEIALHNLELVSVHKDIVFTGGKVSGISEMLDTLLLNQFHDILPGSSIGEVSDRAIKENLAVISRANDKTVQLLEGNDRKSISLYNTLSFKRNDVTVLDGIYNFKGCDCQHYKDINGNDKTAVLGINIEPLSAKNIYISNSNPDIKKKSFFIANGKKLETPFYSVVFSENGEIISLFDKRSSREISGLNDLPLNSLCYGEDIPLDYDAWDINYDYKLKLTNRAELKYTEVVSDGAIEYRIRSWYNFGLSSEIIQDTIFYTNSSRIDFETVVNWQEKHTLLKAMFPLNIHAHFARFETQFGYVERSNNENTSLESTKFEVCNHKWTDISESRYGVSILNDCKYGISVDGNVLGLSLHRGGCSPDERGDRGVHCFTYSLFPHNNGFGIDTVREGYLLNYKPIITKGGSELIKPLFIVDADNVIIETVKISEDGNGYIIRLYEAECNETNFILKAGFDFCKVMETNMLEENLKELDSMDNAIKLKIKPFEIKTIKFIL